MKTLRQWLGKDLDWMLPASIIVLIELLTAAMIGNIVGFHYDLAIKGYFFLGLLFTVWLCWAAAMLTVATYPFRRVDSPISRLRRDVSNHGNFIFSIGFGIMLIVIQICLLNWTKSMIPHVTSFWADPVLAEIDRRLFGKDPWTFLHTLFPQNAVFFDRAYALWAPVKFGTLLFAFLNFSSDRKSRIILSYFLTVLIGLMAQYILPSGGPIFYERLGFGPDFQHLPIPPLTLLGSDYLWDAYETGTGKVGGGISAFPSMHIATSVWFTIAWFRWSKILGSIVAVFTAVVCLATVYLGWHYAIDVLGAFVIALVADRIAKTTSTSNGRLWKHVALAR